MKYIDEQLKLFNEKFGQRIFDLFLDYYDAQEVSSPSTKAHHSMEEIEAFLEQSLIKLEKQVREEERKDVANMFLCGKCRNKNSELMDKLEIF